MNNEVIALTREEIVDFTNLINEWLNFSINHHLDKNESEYISNVITLLGNFLTDDIKSLPDSEKAKTVDSVYELSTCTFNREYVEKLLKERGITR